MQAPRRADSGVDAGATAQRARPLLGTLVAIRIADAPRATPAPRLDAAIDAAFAQIERVHAAMSFHAPDSELSSLNREAFRAPVRVSALLWRVLRASLALARASDGAFDPSIAARLVASGHLPRPDAAQADPQAGWRDIALLSDRRVRFRKPLWLDLGGIAKGHAVDRAVTALQAMSIRGGVVNAGGDLRVFGDATETIRVRDPHAPARSHPLLQLRDGAVATSAGYFSVREGRNALIDPRDGSHPDDRVSVTVSAPRAIWADALTKVVLFDETRGRALLRRLHAQAAVIDAARGTRRL